MKRGNELNKKDKNVSNILTVVYTLSGKYEKHTPVPLTGYVR